MLHNDFQSPHKDATQIVDYKVLIYVPNIIGYIRLALLFAAFYNIESHELFFFLYCSSIILDAFDGIAARKLNQTSQFGALLDVVIDNIGRGLLWILMHPFLYLISVVEWLAFVCNHQFGAEWKKSLVQQGIGDPQQPTIGCPCFVARILSNNFRNFWGVWSVAGLHVLPVWLYAMYCEMFNTHLLFLPYWVPLTGLFILGFGRCICFVAEFWCIWSHISTLLVRSCPASETS